MTVTEDEGASPATNQDMEHNPGNPAGAQDPVHLQPTAGFS